MKRLAINDLRMTAHCDGPIFDVRNAVGFATFAKPQDYGVNMKKLVGE